MKKRTTFTCWLALLCTAASCARAQPAADPGKVQQVAAGKLAEANAAWWGFDADDSTNAIQSAIDSGAKRVIIPNVGKDWVVTPIRLASDQEIYFEEGVVLAAKAGAFKGKFDALLSAEGKKNVALRGDGATLVMRKADYQDAKQYEPGEWRHAVRILGCQDVQVIGLTIRGSGGDGVYVGASSAQGVHWSSRVRLADLVCDDNHRQGISVVSVENLRVERCILRNTRGTPPMAGIDLEPNGPDEKLVDCVIDDCVIEANGGAGIMVAVHQLSEKSPPISVRFQRCVVKSSGRYGVYVYARPEERGHVRGSVTFDGCIFMGTRLAGIKIANKPADGFALRFQFCGVEDVLKVPDANQSPIWWVAEKGSTQRQGGADFVDCIVKQPGDRAALRFHDEAGKTSITNLNGKIIVPNPAAVRMELGERHEGIGLQIVKP